MSASETEPRPGRLSLTDRTLLWVEREGNSRLRRLGTALYRLTRGRLAPRERDVILLTTRGRKSGKSHTVLLQGFRDGSSMVVVAANSGRRSQPDWFRNLAATPTATVELREQRYRVRAEPFSKSEAEAFWPRILRSAPSYARYRRATGRTIPLVRLVPIEPGTVGSS